MNDSYRRRGGFCVVAISGQYVQVLLDTKVFVRSTLLFFRKSLVGASMAVIFLIAIGSNSATAKSKRYEAYILCVHKLAWPDALAPVLAALDDDLNTPAAFAALHALAAQLHSEADPSRCAQIAASLRQAGGFLGLLQQDPVAWAHAGASEVDQIEVLVAMRTQADADNDWQRADKLWDQLLALGVEVEDSGGESRWRMRA